VRHEILIRRLQEAADLDLRREFGLADASEAPILRMAALIERPKSSVSKDRLWEIIREVKYPKGSPIAAPAQAPPEDFDPEENTTGYEPQAFIHTSPIDPARFRPPTNPHRLDHGYILKPQDGLYTSTHHDDGQWLSPWDYHLDSNEMNRRGKAAHIYDVDPKARIFNASKPGRYEELMDKYGLPFATEFADNLIPHPDRGHDEEGFPHDRLHLDFEALAQDYDGLHIPEGMATGHARRQMMHKGVPYLSEGFGGYDVPTTLWFKHTPLRYRETRPLR
jgi:hypothetical protein